jgi:hypothetical protein
MALLPAILALSCARLDRGAAAGEGAELEPQTLPSTDMVPLEWGNLVSVTSAATGDARLLWFQDEAGTIRVVAYKSLPPQLWPTARVIRRN